LIEGKQVCAFGRDAPGNLRFSLFHIDFQAKTDLVCIDLVPEKAPHPKRDLRGSRLLEPAPYVWDSCPCANLIFVAFAWSRDPQKISSVFVRCETLQPKGEELGNFSELKTWSLREPWRESERLRGFGQESLLWRIDSRDPQLSTP
jgi:hypothetical protein